MTYSLSDTNKNDAFTIEVVNAKDVASNEVLANETVRLFTILTNAEIEYHNACGIVIKGQYTKECILTALQTKEKVFFLKTADGKYIGMCWMGPSGFQNVENLSALVVESGYRGRGLGSKIINAVIAAYPKMSISLKVSVANPHALSLYRQLGFKDTDISMVRHAN